MIEKSKSYSPEEFNQKESTLNKINNSSEFIPASTILHGILLYVDINVNLTNITINQEQQLAFLLSSLVKQVFHISVETLYLFRDIHSGRIVLNSNRSLFYNIRYLNKYSLLMN
ncbi:unnamed protein product [Rotaria socialis]|uniref:Uncharacterized protein n=1 Tax=Rotaria socialis TaxID=392032 RepID=A0A818B8E1_9BILA|nr:unnamed protein product [Rotaria socialis]CAF4426539.1 unnamed protein product [Rotaria socialis]